MALLKIAQYENDNSYHEEKKWKILKQMDINYCVPDTLPDNQKPLKDWSGYTSLHFAVKQNNIVFTKDLLQQGADLMKQSTTCGYTPLHLSVRQSKKNIYRISGPLSETSLMDVLLGKQVEQKNVANPKNKYGVSHFHIACIVNHTEAVTFFIKAGRVSVDELISVCEVDDSDNPASGLQGYTPLHCAIRYSSCKPVYYLLKNGADVHIKDAKGMSCVHLIMERIMLFLDHMTLGTRLPCEIILEEIKRMQHIIILILTERASNETFVDDTGLSALHLACLLENKAIVENCLNLNSDVNMPIKSDSNLWPGWTPLHFAACTSVQTMIQVIENGGDCTIKNSKGETALDLCARRFAPVYLQKILLTKQEFDDIILSDNGTKLTDLLLAMNDCDEFDGFLQQFKDTNLIIPTNSPIWPGYNLLHLCVSLNERTKRWEDLENVHDLYLSGYIFATYNHREKEKISFMERIEVCLKYNCSVCMKNPNGQTPIHLAFSTLKDKAVLEKLLICCQDDAIDENNLSHLHIACAVGQLDAIKMLLSKGANVNSRVKKSLNWHRPLETIRVDSTPLHLATMIGNEKVLQYLLENNADVYAKDSLGLTPIHLSVTSVKRLGTRPFFSTTARLQDSISDFNLSHLHVAVCANDHEAVKTLLLEGAEVDRVVNANVIEDPSFARLAGNTPLLLARLFSADNEIFEALLKGGANVHAKDPEGMSLLQYVTDIWITSWSQLLIQMVKDGKLDVLESGMTLLHFACINFDIEWAEELLKKGSDVNAKISFQNVSSDMQEATPLHIICNHRYARNFSSAREFFSFVKLLFENGVDLTIKYDGFTELYWIFEIDAYEYPESVSEAKFFYFAMNLLFDSHKSYDFNPVDSKGFSHFHFACVLNKVEAVKNFLDHGVDVNLSVNFFEKYGGFTPLHFALSHHCKEVAYLLLERGADVNAENVDGNTPLLVAMKEKFLDLQLIEAMLSRGADIFAENLENENPLVYLLKSDESDIFELFKFVLNSYLSKNAWNVADESLQTVINSVMLNTESPKCELILDWLMQTPYVKNAIQHGFCVIQSILNASVLPCVVPSPDLVTVIDVLVFHGCDIDQQDAQGETPLHKAVFFNSSSAVYALLKLGADANVINTKEYLFSDKIVSSFDDDMTTTSFDIDIVQKFALHFWKMRFIGLDVADCNIKCIQRVEERLSFLTSLQTYCQRELIKAEATEIYQSVTVKDFLSETRAVAEYRRMHHEKRDTVDKFFKNSKHLRQQFPEYCGILLYQYRKARARIELWQPAKEAIVLICQFELPYICLEEILRYFTNREMKLVVESVEQLFN